MFWELCCFQLHICLRLGIYSNVSVGKSFQYVLYCYCRLFQILAGVEQVGLALLFDEIYSVFLAVH